ncbi:MAG: ABC transporter ATP-binding protein [Candidatus Heimdallarchaeaceae archaeon]
MNEIIKLESIRKRFNGKEVLSGINLKIKSGERFGIFGPSGCGKTTLLRIIAGLEKPDDGRVYLRGKEVTSNKIFVPPEKRNISFIFQDLALWPHMSVKEHLEFVLSNKIRKNLKKEIERVLKIIKLTGHLNSKPEELSGGEKQRLAIGRAIAQRSDIFLLDEPLSSLDFFLKKEMKNLLLKLQKRYKLTIVYVAHDIFEIIDMCNRIAVIENGKISKIGHPRKLFKNQIMNLKV